MISNINYIYTIELIVLLMLYIYIFMLIHMKVAVVKLIEQNHINLKSQQIQY